MDRGGGQVTFHEGLVRLPPHSTCSPAGEQRRSPEGTCSCTVRRSPGAPSRVEGLRAGLEV